MKCPYCGYGMSKVLNSRPTEDNKSIRRRRQCEKCERRFTTYEKTECMPIMVVKSNQTREAFDREKLLKGIVRSCNKRPITMDEMDDVVVQIENQIYFSERKEITSAEIGEMTMERMKKIDEVAYIRFASVYKKFQNIDEFIAELEAIKQRKQ
ncbi:MAG: transcriptional regulator NrdR [Cellulosilyticaceae bacterium]